jgi:hypothetical protein
MTWHPTFSVRSERPAWRQVVRGSVTFAVGAVVVVGLLAATGWAKGASDRRRDARAERAAMASLGLERMCVGDAVDRGCVHRAADLSGAAVAWVPDAPGDLLASTGTRRAPARLDAAPLSYNAMAFRYAVLEELWTGSPTGLSYDLVSGPRARPDGAYKREGRVVVHDVRVDVFVRTLAACGCRDEPGLRKVWATWHHDGHAYAAWFVLGERDGTPAAFLDAVLAHVEYTGPTRRV